MPTASIKITQAANTDLAGRALVGDTLNDVVFSNGDNTGVVAWAWTVLYVPPGSSVPLATGTSPTLNIGTPDVVGSYRVRLVVTDSDGVTDTDIRVFAVPTANQDYIIPPYQANPPQLPLFGTGAKADEMNFGGQAFGWAGDLSAGRTLLHAFIVDVDTFIGGAVTSVFTRTGAVVAAASDYDASQVDNDSGVVGVFVSDALNTLDGDIASLSATVGALVTGVSSVFGRSGAVAAAASDYDASQVDNDSGVVGADVAEALDTLDADIGALVTGVSSVFGRTGAVVAAASDYDASQVDNDSGVVGVTVSDALDTLDAKRTFSLSDGYTWDVLPDVAVRGLIAGGGGTVTDALTLDEGYWHHLVVNVVVNDQLATAYYTHLQKVEAYRETGGGAVIHSQRSPAVVDDPSGGDWAVAVSASGNDIEVEVTNDSTTPVTYATYITSRWRAPIPNMSPIDVSGLVFWGADQVTGVATAGYQVTDLSGAGNHGTQPTTSNQPTSSGGVLNFAAASTQFYAISGAGLGLDAGTETQAVWVYRMQGTSDTPAARRYPADSTSPQALRWFLETGGTNMFLDWPTSSNRLTVAGASVDYSAEIAFTVIFDAGTVTLRVNGSVVGSASVGIAAIPAMGFFEVGGHITNQTWDGTMRHAFIVVGRVPTEAELQLLENWV